MTMREQMQNMPKWLKRVLLVVSIVGPVSGAIATGVTTYYDLKDRAADAKRKSEAGYETLAPAIKELQEILHDGQEWAEETDNELHDLIKENRGLEARVIRLEAYIEMLSQRRNLPAAPPKPAPVPDVMAELPFHKKKHTAKKPARPVPQEIDDAAQYQQQRIQKHCPPGDPLCGL